jgi:glycine betaine/proline transport system substrate-binding protein
LLHAESGSKGRLIACPVAGWNCHDQKRLDLLGIDFEADELGTETAALAEAQAAYDRKEPFLLYLWEPHFFFGAYEMVGV